MSAKELYSFIREIEDIEEQEGKVVKLLDQYKNSVLQAIINAVYNIYKDFQFSGQDIKLPKKCGELDITEQPGTDIAFNAINDLDKDRVLYNKSGFVRELLERFNIDSQLILIMMITKDMPWKVELESIKAVWPDLLPVFKSPISRRYGWQYHQKIWKNHNNWKSSLLVDGTPVYVIKDYKGEIKIYTKQLRQILIVQNLVKELHILLRNQYAVVLDCVLCKTNRKGELDKILKQRITIKHIQLLHPKLFIYDMIPLHTFINKCGNMFYFDRLNWLKDTFGQMINLRLEGEYFIYKIKYIELVEQLPINDKNIYSQIKAWKSNSKIYRGIEFKENKEFFVGHTYNSAIIRLLDYYEEEFEVMQVLKTYKNYYIKDSNATKKLPIVKSIAIKANDKIVFIEEGFDKEFIIKFGRTPNELVGKKIKVGFMNKDTKLGLRYPMYLGRSDDEK